MEFANSQRAVENRKGWRELVAKSSVDRAGVRQLPEGCEEQERMERAGCQVVSGAPTTRTGYGKVK